MDNKFKSDSTIKTLEQIEKETIIKTMLDFDHNQTKTAKALGISLRTLQNKLREYQEPVLIKRKPLRGQLADHMAWNYGEESAKTDLSDLQNPTQEQSQEKKRKNLARTQDMDRKSYENGLKQLKELGEKNHEQLPQGNETVGQDQRTRPSRIQAQNNNQSAKTGTDEGHDSQSDSGLSKE